MQTALAIAASGLRHADARQRATAHDTANLTTPETTVLRAVGRERSPRPEGAGQGVDTVVEGRTERRPELGAEGTPTGTGTDAVGHAVDQIVTTHAAGALGQVVRTGDDMLGSLLDVVG